MSERPDRSTATDGAKIEETAASIPEHARPGPARKETTVRGKLLDGVMREERTFLIRYIAKYLDFGKKRSTPADYEDVLQELFLRLNGYTNLAELQATIDNPEKRKGWLVGELKSVIRKYRQNKARSPQTENEDIDWERVIPDSSVSVIHDPILGKRLAQAVESLPELERSIFKLLIEGNNEEEIMHILDISAEQVVESSNRIRLAIKDTVDIGEFNFNLVSPLDTAIQTELQKKGIDQPLDTESLHKIVAVAALKLPAFYQRLLHLYYYQGQTNRQIALIVGSHPATVHNNIIRTFTQLFAEVVKQIKAVNQNNVTS
jgi:RNA polymerase sigma factor (sigma-70 family)